MVRYEEKQVEKLELFLISSDAITVVRVLHSIMAILLRNKQLHLHKTDFVFSLRPDFRPRLLPLLYVLFVRIVHSKVYFII